MKTEIVDYNSYEHEERLIQEAKNIAQERELKYRSMDESEYVTQAPRRPIYKNENQIRVEKIQGQISGVSSFNSSKRDNFLTNPGFVSTQGDQNYGSPQQNQRRQIEFKATLQLDTDDLNESKNDEMAKHELLGQYAENNLK